MDTYIGIAGAQVYHSRVPGAISILRVCECRRECVPHAFRSRTLDCAKWERRIRVQSLDLRLISCGFQVSCSLTSESLYTSRPRISNTYFFCFPPFCFSVTRTRVQIAKRKRRPSSSPASQPPSVGVHNPHALEVTCASPVTAPT
jgi:hypothetical protein